MDFPEEKSNMMMKLKAPCLVDLCVETVIDNLRYLGDVGETDLHLLDRILPHCSIDHLKRVEKGSQVTICLLCSNLGFCLCHSILTPISCREEI